MLDLFFARTLWRVPSSQADLLRFNSDLVSRIMFVAKLSFFVKHKCL